VRPLRGIHRDDVGVAHDEERSLAAVPFEASDDVRAIGVERYELRGDAFAIEHALDVLRGATLVAGRVACVDSEYGLEVLRSSASTIVRPRATRSRTNGRTPVRCKKSRTIRGFTSARRTANE